MKRRSVFRQILALGVAGALWLAALPWAAIAAREEDGGYRRIGDFAEMVSGRYVLVDTDGFAPLAYDGESGWITAAEPVLEEDAVTDSMDAVWTLTVTEGGVLLQDANGIYLAPGTDGNGIAAGEYLWSVTWNGGAFSFHGTSGENPVTLARNGDSGYRAVRDSLVEGFPEGYPCAFALYRQTEGASEETTGSTETEEETTEETGGEPTSVPTEVPTEEPTEATEEEPAEETTEPKEDLTELPEAGNYVIWDPVEMVALSARRQSEGSRYYDGTAVKLTDGELTGYTAEDVWTLAWEGDVCILCHGEEVLGTSADYPGISYSEGDTRWVLEVREEGWWIRNAVSGRYVRYAPDFACWTSGNTEETATVLRLTPAGEITEPEETRPEETTPEETTPGTEPETVTGPVIMTPEGGEMLPGTVTLTCETEGAVIYYATSADGEAFPEYTVYREPIVLKTGFEVCYIRAYAQAENQLPGETVTCRFTEQAAKGKGLYFGQLHAHCGISDGVGTAAEAFEYASQVPNLDFFALTDQSNSFDNALSGAISREGGEVSEEWAEGKAAAQAATTRDFVGIFGYEMAWPTNYKLGHINTFSTPGFQAWNQEAYRDRSTALVNYYDTLTGVPDSISQFNHPGTDGGNFQNFGHYSEARDAVIQLLEVGTGADAFDYYFQALDLGWHVAPSNNQNNHGNQFGNESDCRTVVLADSLTEQGIYDAIRAYRVYATEDRDLEITYTLDGWPMGTLLEKRDVGSSVTIKVWVADATDGSDCQAEVLGDGGNVLAEKRLTEGSCTFTLSSDYSYYVVRITQPDGDRAVTAPVWIDGEEDAGILAFTADQTRVEQGQAVNLTLTLYNRETTALTVDRITFCVEGTPFYTTREITGVGAKQTASCTVPLTWSGLGQAEVTVEVTASLDGQSRTYGETLTLHFVRENSGGSQLVTIGEARTGEAGTVWVIRGYVTAGTSDPWNTFPDTIYVQDNTGGIAVTGFAETGVEIGTPLEVEGTIGSEGGNVVLELLDWNVLDGDRYRYVAESLSLAEAMNVSLHGGELLKIEGTVISVTAMGSTGVSRFILADADGNRAAVDIEESILSGSTGKNELAYVVKTGRTVRATGLLYVSADGEPALRVRNCDEVVYVPSLPYTGETEAATDNPKTGDELLSWLGTLPVPVAAWLLLKPRPRRKKRR